MMLIFTLADDLHGAYFLEANTTPKGTEEGFNSALALGSGKLFQGTTQRSKSPTRNRR